MVSPHHGHQQHSPASGCGLGCCSPASEGRSQQTWPLGITTQTTDRCSTWSTASWNFTSLSKRELRSTDPLLTSSMMTWCLLQVMLSSLIHVLASSAPAASVPHFLKLRSAVTPLTGTQLLLWNGEIHKMTSKNKSCGTRERVAN